MMMAFLACAWDRLALGSQGMKSFAPVHLGSVS